ncbi:alpha/beta fold hydrolase [Demequina sp. SYSU T00068]|uniref:alpha/beta hydrolase n=1 Tax=Demequina lignilytica TaxID=3051663 RepID=UPI00262F1DB2|nr:alpha/beta fold hydrolase [Demequina sp. SYSU T00068]MDN4489237.1 alpha/beta fold hydrolase [Demequina sp. SYSU T00068]
MPARYRRTSVPVEGGDLAVGVWEPDGDAVGEALLIHGVTSSHLAWAHIAALLPGMRLVAPDLRGRGGSREVAGPAGMAAHAADMVAVMDAFGMDAPLVVGHSMGGFVAVVLADVAPDRVGRLLLLDGGLPLGVPAGLTPEDLVRTVLGPTAARLSMTFADTAAYLEFWRAHPAFARDWTPELEDYFAYDLVESGNGLRPATTYETTAEDTVDLHTGDALRVALDHLRVPTTLLTAPRGLLDEAPGLYAAERLEELLRLYPSVAHREVPDVNHYTLVMSPRGAEEVAPDLLAAAGARSEEGAGR